MMPRGRAASVRGDGVVSVNAAAKRSDGPPVSPSAGGGGGLLVVHSHAGHSYHITVLGEQLQRSLLESLLKKKNRGTNEKNAI
jgi:hypothetical protein